ncbi:MAG: DMT family transporter [Planctomycetota bacterium]
MDRRSAGLLALWAAVGIWALPPLFIRYFTRFYDLHTQNFFRYLAACAGLVLLRAMARPKRFFPTRGEWAGLLAPTVANLVFQTCNVAALYRIDPGLVAFLGKSAVIFSAIFAFALFREERSVIRSPLFLAGGALALAGVTGLSTFRIGGTDDFAKGVVLTLIGAAGWGAYVVAIRHAVRSISPATSYTFVSLNATVAFGAAAILFGKPGEFVSAGLLPAALLVLSGLLCLAVAHTAYYYAIERLGAAIPGTAILASPLLTVFLSRWIFGERLSAMQAVSGGALLVGALLTVRAGPSGKGRDASARGKKGENALDWACAENTIGVP